MIRNKLIAALFVLLIPPAALAVDCRVSAQGVDFGIYDSLTQAPNDTVGAITVTCTNNWAPGKPWFAYSVRLSAGVSGDARARTLRQGQSKLSYNLYLDVPRQRIWGDGLSGTSSASGSFFFLPFSDIVQEQTHTIYARIPASQDTLPGPYLDTITVTLTF